MCVTNHYIATVAALTTVNPLLHALPSNEQQTFVLLLLHACFEFSAFQQLPHWANMPQYFISSVYHIFTNGDICELGFHHFSY
jgi:hypothetical protein